MESIEKTGHMADALGTTTEALLGMQYAAKHAGVGAEEFGQSMRHLEKEIGNPTKEVSEALSEIGLSAAALNGQDASKQFDRIARGIGALGTQSEKAAVSAALFGRQGVQLVSMFDDYEGIDAYVERVTKLGGAFSSIDAMQVREANHALEDMHTAFDAIFTKLAVNFSPLITSAADKLISLGTDGTSVADMIGKAFLDVTRTMLRLVDTIDLAKAAFYGLGSPVLWIAAQYEKLIGNLDELGSKAYGAVGNRVGGNLGAFLRDQAQGKHADAQDEFATGNRLADYSSRALDVAAEKLKSAVNGDRSMSWQKAFDDIFAKSRKSASDRVDEANAKRGANTIAEAAQSLKGLFTSMRGRFASGTDAASRLGDKAEKMLASQMISNLLTSGLAFMKTLPMRALKAGWRPPMDLQTSVRGSFSGDTAGRMSATYSIEQKQLEESKKQTEIWQQLLAQFQAGVVAP